MMDNIREKLVELLDEARAKRREICYAHTDCNSCVFGEEGENCGDKMIADHLLANGVTVQEWIPVTERLPKPEEEVWVQCERGQFKFKYQCKAFYIPPKWLREDSALNWDYECCNEYDEEADDYYVNEGWYERIHNWDDYSAVGIGDFVTHWMPLPTPPKGE